MIHVHACINQNPCGSTKEYITRIPYLNYVSGGVVHITAFSLQAAVSPLITSLCLQFTNSGYDINFGFARSIGSLGYSLMALVMGNVTEMFGSEVILPVFIGIYQVSAVYYVYSIVGKKDIVKGQSLMGIATVGICPMLSNFLGGMMIETIPLKMFLLIGIIIQSAAMLICFIATDQNRFKADYHG